MYLIKKELFTIIIFFFLINFAFSKDITTLNSYSHDENQCSNTTTISVEWTAPSVSGDKYYATFSKGITFVFDEYDPSDPEDVPEQVIPPARHFSHSIERTSHTVDSEGTYYFNIVIDSEGEYGATASIGPFIIDTTAPSPVNVYGVTETDSNSIELTLEPADADQVCILLNTTNTVSCSWGYIPENRKLISPTLSEGNNQIYAFFKDIAGNTNQASHNISCSFEENEQEPTTQKAVSIPTLSEWGQILFLGILVLGALGVIHRNKIAYICASE
ncbi:conserved hypothetical protein, secreted [Candidatus Magnetomorum sp. HK-1]|nr:conserved hypothetical protein, secreted [Candidatus Magnetomorum sp. HK-1]